ncbi:transglycosylase SLT domain-containing protein [Synechococcus elongatus]|uniref:Probable soluble lytic transglycosylase n=1 Tax=Synechococcus elongatus (strain ATCC 33912 / PCC 7942 / FACHB-805) TaxID=1140 RepID=Q31LA8_SYNE7|nr:transglycosylase SLT domain-containing protein [Synechococcus elongatus]ABB58161.1 probable soluble lytic transglycosylase [Synechococcus elongatus PCC 7942 = FACHB-805]AJD57363.1 lytic transglycosylase [Synechococcus elongatus UTEX 2973]MBD2586880.1 transglycosylase SLT domain-containing protein [Synechococcus elongatus FACHB-242]MBD2687951.1 transglycosylase SLT domain-containing protein [Synechococcus elongatus FACHB-1061]MBD2706338.1 transglycosylase SLT domain-containing protein [Synec
MSAPSSPSTSQTRPPARSLWRRRRTWFLVGGGGLGAAAVVVLLGIWWRSPTPEAAIALRQSDFAELRWQSRFAMDAATRQRARFLYALAIAPDQPQAALQALQGLERSYPLLGPYILKLRAQVQTQLGQDPRETWRQLLNTYPESPVQAEAVLALGQWDLAPATIQRWPRYPASNELARQLAKRQPAEAKRWLLQIAQFGRYRFDIDAVLSELQALPNLTARDRQQIADAYWQRDDYATAADLYARSPQTDETLYRQARSLDLSSQPEVARTLYQQLLQRFPQSPERERALVHLVRLDPANRDRYLQLLERQFARSLPEALGLAAATEPRYRPILLQRFPASPEAAALRWQQAWQQAEAGNLPQAIALVTQTRDRSPTIEAAAQAGFWLGRWQTQLGQTDAAQAAWQWVLQQHPDSYYAWRSAAALGWPVGDFSQVQAQQPAWPQAQSPQALPAGSAVLKELYALGQTEDAWRLWQQEGPSRDPSPSDRFISALLEASISRYDRAASLLKGLPIDSPLRQRSDFVSTLYPVVFKEEITAATQRDRLNPLLVLGLIRQESRFLPGATSVVGARGLMQLMPETAAEVAAELGLQQYDLGDPQTNIQLGSRYLRNVLDYWREDSLFAIASYNAGPGNVENWVRRFGRSDRDRWLEQIPFPETRDYVEKVLSNYWNYLRQSDRSLEQRLQQLDR